MAQVHPVLKLGKYIFFGKIYAKNIYIIIHVLIANLQQELC